MPAGGLHTATAACESWLEVIDSDSPLLLIAPHGGRAEPRTRSLLNPKVNDLHTADITRGLAARLNASALINVAMDRNRLDCNRLSQIIERAPWLLELIADRVGAIVARHGRASISDLDCAISAASCGRPVPLASRPATILSTALSPDSPTACIAMESRR